MAENDSDARERGGSPPARRRRRWLRLVALLVALPLVLLGVLALALQSRGVRQALLGRVDRAVREATGLALTAEDWSLGLLSGRLEVVRPALGAPDGPPLLTVERVTAEVDLASLLGPRTVVRSLVVQAPRLDLATPLPEPPAREEAAPAGEPALDILAFRVSGAAVASGTVPEQLAGWLEAWAAEGVEASGSYRGGDLSLVLERATLPVTLAMAGERHALTLSAAATVQRPADGALVLDALTVTAPGLELTASGRAGPGEAGPRAVRFALEVDAAALVPRLASAGRARGRGHLDLPSWTGELDLAAEDFPADLLTPWLGRDTLERLGGGRTRLDLAADLAVARGAAQPVRGELTLAWRRGQETLVEVVARPTGGGFDPSGRLDLRTLSGEVRLAAPELPAEILAPWLGREEFAGMGAAGSDLGLAAQVAVDPGADVALVGQATVAWSRGQRRLLEVRARARGGRFEESGRLDLASLASEARLEARGLPAEVLAPWIGEAEFARIGARGTDLDLTTDLSLVGLSLERLAARTQAVWRRQGERLVTVQGQSAGGARQVTLGFDLSLLPDRPGRRKLAGELALPPGAEVTRARLTEARLDLVLPDLAAAVAEIRRHWPDLVPEAVAAWPLAGALEAAVTAQGDLESPEVKGTAAWRPGGDSAAHLAVRKRPGELAGEGALHLESLDLGHLGVAAAGTVAGTVSVAGTREDFDLRADLEAADLELEGGEGAAPLSIGSARIRLEGAVAEGRRARLATLAAELDGRSLRASGSFDLALPPARADLRLELVAPVEGLRRADLALTLEAGELRLASRRLESEAGEASLQATVPLAALKALPDLGERLEGWGVAGDPAAAGPVVVTAALPRVESDGLLRLLGLADRVERLQAEGLDLTLRLQPTDLTASTGELAVAALEAATPEHRLAVEGPVRLALAGRRLTLAPARWRVDGRPLDLSGSLRLAEGWRPGDDPAALVAELTAEGRGVLEASLLNPYLGGGVADGTLAVVVALRGPLDRLSGEARVDGREASLFFYTPYATRLDRIELELALARGEVAVRTGQARLNEGTATLSGSWRDSEGLVLDLRAADLRYRLDYGLSALLSADLAYTLPPEGRSRISGTMVLERGLVRREIDLEQELLARLFAPADLAGAAETAAHGIDLDLTLTTLDGVRVRNNVADLRVIWSPLQIRGTLAEPLVDGRLDVEPGGLIFAYGQVLRVDQAGLVLAGRPGAEPRLEIATTSSLDDPSIARPGGGSPLDLASPTPRQAPEVGAAVAEGVAGYFGGRLASSLGESLGGAEISIRPVLAFREADPDARLTVSRDLTRNLALAVSLNLREAERRTYLLDLQEFGVLPGFGAQLFTNEASNQGATVQHRFRFGGGARDPRLRDQPRLGTIHFEPPPGVSRRRLRKTMGLERGEPLPEGALFDLEVAVSEHLRRLGYPSPRVAATDRPSDRGEGVVDVAVAIQPGPRASFVFRGDRPPAALEPSITSLYRSDYYEPASLTEMAQQTVRALRSQGFLEPEVALRVDKEDPADPRSPRTVVIEAQGGDRVDLEEVVFRGVGAEEAAALAARFAGPVARVELAAGTAEADARLLATLRALGYPEARVAGRTLEAGGERLVVEVEPGRRQRLASVRLGGLDGEEAAGLRPLVAVAPGDPVRHDRLTVAALLLEEELRRRGYADAQVRSVLEPAGDAQPGDLAAIFEVAPGPRYEVAEVRFEGLEATRAAWAAKTSGLPPGSLLRPDEVAEARRRFFAAGLFATVYADTQRQDDGRATVTFRMAEKPRFTLAYGVRWESEEGASAVADAIDHNFLGRGITLGVRGLYQADDQLARLYLGIPRTLGTRAGSLEYFAQARREDDEGFLTDTLETSLQLSLPLVDRVTGRIYGRYREQRFRLDDPFFPIDERVVSPFLGVQLVYEGRAEPAAGAPGLFASADLSGADRFLGSDFKFLRFFGQVHYLRPAFRVRGRQIDWAQSYRLGLADAFGGQSLIRSERFFAGGEFSVRGYDTESLGPVEDLILITRPLGGEALLVVNQELRFPIWQQLSGVGFFDLGNVWEEKRDLGSDLSKAVGFGLRADTALGLLRLDLAFPLDRREQDSTVRVYVGFGHVF